jgi:hypothetical protein
MDNEFQPKPDAPEGFDKPVSWLIGRDLIAGLKWIALYSAFKGKIDPRDWMRGNAFPRYRDDDQVSAFWRRQKARQWKWKIDNDRFWAEYRQRWAVDHPGAPDFWREGEGTKKEDFWFDYIADAGDGQMAGYNVAYLCLSDLWTKTDASKSAPVSFDESAECPTLLPRGQFLFVGGDTAYHIADYTSLAARFQLPFHWAFNSLRKWLFKEKKRLLTAPDEQGRIPIKDAAGEFVAFDSEPRRPIFGIPGNHDYYDLLHGFNRQFRAPAVTADNRRHLPRQMRCLTPQLTLPGFLRHQQASYVAVHLPFGWWFWGLDTEVSKLDVRQQAFFTSLNGGALPEKLIIATPEPTTVFRQRKAEADKTIEAYVVQLGLQQPFLAAADETPGKCRLDLAGDVHHYARYYGPDDNILGERLSSNHYASVVAGGAGAFHHPTETHLEGPEAIPEQVLYPDPHKSHNLIAERLFDLRYIWGGGYVWLFGMIIAAATYFAVTVPPSSKQLFEWLMSGEARMSRRLLWIRGLQVPFEPDSIFINFIYCINFTCPDASPELNLTLIIFSMALLLVALCFVVASILIFVGILKRVSEGLMLLDKEVVGQPHTSEAASVRKTGEEDECADTSEPRPPQLTKYRDLLSIGVCLLAALAFYVFGIRGCVKQSGALPAFGSSLLVLYHLMLAAGLCVLSVQNSAWLAQLSKFAGSAAEAKARHVPVILLSAGAAGIAFFGVWMFGRYPASSTLSDCLFALTMLGLLAGLTAVGWKFGGEFQGTAGKVLLAVVGFWHGVLQLAAPLWLVRFGDWRALLVSLLVLIVFSGLSVPYTRIRVAGLGARIMLRREPGSRWPLLLLWAAYGLVILALPFIFHDRATVMVYEGSETANQYGTFLPHTWVPALSHPWLLYFTPHAPKWAVFFIGLAAAVVLGFLLSMSWLSWYFAVALGFQGHNNEVGGAARIEQFKHIVRVRIRRDELTAYVIAFDEPQVEGAMLKPRLVDVFRLITTRDAASD